MFLVGPCLFASSCTVVQIFSRLIGSCTSLQDIHVHVFVRLAFEPYRIYNRNTSHLKTPLFLTLVPLQILQMSSSELQRRLHIALFPFMAPGHTLPILDIASLLSARGVKTTIITTPLNAPDISRSLKNRDTNNNITLEIFPFSSEEVGLPEGVQTLEHLPSVELAMKFIASQEVLMKVPLEKFLSKTRPDCLVADMFFPFATEVAAKFGIPRLVFGGSSCFGACVEDALKKYEPQNSVSSDDEYFTIPHLPHEIRVTKSQMIPGAEKEGNAHNDIPITGVLKAAHEAELKSYGVLFNSFYELEPDYVDYYRNALGRRAWPIGPVSICNHHIEDKLIRGKMASIDKDEILKWLDSKEPNSVIYLCFGSLTWSFRSQAQEIAMALEASGLDFIWVVPNKSGKEVDGFEKEELELLPKGFEKRVEGKGLIIKGWAPQVLILDHEAVGGFLTHCGWNSTLEGISAGVPMATWPLYAEQFYNEKLVTDVLKIGVQVGSKVWNGMAMGIVLKRDKIEVALKRLMVGEEAMEMRNRAKKLKEMAHKAMEEGGSSFCQLSALIEDLRNYGDNN